MDTVTIRQKLQDYIKVAEDKKVKAIYIMVEDEINASGEWCENEELMSELDKRSANLKSGLDKGVSWSISKDQVLSTRKNFLDDIEPVTDFPSIEEIRKRV